MVDFQSRSTHRDHDEEDEADEDDEGETQDTEGESGHVTETLEYEADTAKGTTYAVVTVASDRTLDTDTAGDAVVAAIEQAGDVVVTRELVTPSYDGVQQALDTLVGRKDVDSVVTVGGTGIEPDDVTVDAALDLFERRLPGFGELFRILSHEHDGSAVVRTRATAGVIENAPVFCLPGDPTAARRGVDQLVVNEAPELVALAAEEDSTAESTK